MSSVAVITGASSGIGLATSRELAAVGWTVVATARHPETADGLRELAELAGVEWTVPLPVLTRLLLSTIDGVVLRWLVDRDSASALAVLDGFADTLGSLAHRA